MKFISLFAAALLSFAHADPTCQKTNANLNLTNTPMPTTDASPTLNQANAYMNDYFKAWNQAAKKSQQIRPDDLSSQDIDQVMRFYADDVQITQNDSGIAGAPAVVFPGVKDFARTNFVEFFLAKQRGSVHKPDYVCVAGNKVSVGLHYYAPHVGKYLNPAHPETGDVAVGETLMGTYVFANGVIQSLTLTYDFQWFVSESAKNGVPVQ